MPVFKKLFQSLKRLFRRRKTSHPRKSRKKKSRPFKRPSRAAKPAKRKAVAKKATVKKLKVKPKPVAKAKLKAKPAKAPAQRKEILVGEVTHYFNKIEVIVIKMKSGTVSVGEEIHIKGSGTDFTQKVASLQIESVDVKVVKKGQLAGLKVKDKAKVGDLVYKVLS